MASVSCLIYSQVKLATIEVLPRGWYAVRIILCIFVVNSNKFILYVTLLSTKHFQKVTFTENVASVQMNECVDYEKKLEELLHVELSHKPAVKLYTGSDIFIL